MTEVDTEVDTGDEIRAIHPMHNHHEHELFMEHVAQEDHGLLYLDTLLHEMEFAE